MTHKTKLASLILATGLLAGVAIQSADAQITFQRGDLSQYQSMDMNVNLDDGVNSTTGNAPGLSPVDKAGTMVVQMLNGTMAEQVTDNTPWVHNQVTITFHDKTGNSHICDLSTIIAKNLTSTQTVNIANYCQ
jgi:hypothetical protein